MQLIGDIHHQRGDKLRVSDTQGEGWLCGEVTPDLLWAVGTGPRARPRAIRPPGATLHGEGGLAPVVNVRVGAAVSGRSRALGEVLGGPADLPAGGQAVAGAGRFVRDPAAHQKGKRVAADSGAGRELCCWEPPTTGSTHLFGAGAASTPRYRVRPPMV